MFSVAPAMSGKQIAGDDLSSNLAGMSKSQLLDIMSQMKILIEQNHQQAREILVQNPSLTRSLFQAQIMLGMVKPPQAVPNITSSVSQQPQASAPQPQQSNLQAAQQLPGQAVPQDQTSVAQVQIPVRKQYQNPSAMLVSSAPAPVADLQSQSMLSQIPKAVQPPKGHFNAHLTSVSLPQTSQIPNVPPTPPHHSASQPSSMFQPQSTSTSGQLPQQLQSNSSLQPPLPPQARPLTSISTLPQQFHSQIGPNMGYQQHSGVPQLHYSQPMFHSGAKPPLSMGPSFLQGQQAHPSQLPTQPVYQMSGHHLGTDFNNQVANSMQGDRGSSWMPGQPDKTAAMQLPGPPPLNPMQMGLGNQPHPPPLSPEMEKLLLQQVMSLSPEQINLLPPEQRHQVLQLQQMLRQ